MATKIFILFFFILGVCVAHAQSSTELLFSTDSTIFEYKNLEANGHPLLFPSLKKLRGGHYIVYNPHYNIVEMEFDVNEEGQFDGEMFWYKQPGNYGIEGSKWFRIQIYKNGEPIYLINHWWQEDVILDFSKINKRHKEILKKLKLKFTPL